MKNITKGCIGDPVEAALNASLRGLTCALLRCGEEDLEALARVKCGWLEVLARVTWENDGGIRYDDLMWAVADAGIARIRGALERRIRDLSSRWREDEPDGHGLGMDGEKELACLSLLDPEKDIFSLYEYQPRDTRVWFDKNEELYRKYLPGALEAFEEGTGMKIERRC